MRKNTFTIKQIIDNLPGVKERVFNISELEPELIKMGYTPEEINKAKEEYKQ